MISFILDYSVTLGILTIYNLSNSFEQKRKVPGVYVSGSPRSRKRIHQALALEMASLNSEANACELLDSNKMWTKVHPMLLLQQSHELLRIKTLPFHRI